MWIVIKYKKKEINFLKNEIKNKIGNDVKFYNPTLCLQQIRKNIGLYTEKIWKVLKDQ